MKKILFFILVFTSNLCFAQIEVQKEELLEHQGIVTVRKVRMQFTISLKYGL